MITNSELVLQARELVGVPWRHQGRATWGVDCIGLISLSFQKAGFDWAKIIGVVDKCDYGRNAQPELLRLVREHCEHLWRPIDGCLIVIRFPQEKYPRHFGIYAQGNIIHADARVGQVVEHSYGGVWKRCEHSLWKIPGVLYA